MDLALALDSVHDVSAHVDALCAPAPEQAARLQQSLKLLFDLSVQCCPQLQLGPLAELYVANMDSESVWEQMQSRHRPLNRFIEQSTKQLHSTVPPPKKGRDQSQHREKENNKNSQPARSADVDMDVADDDDYSQVDSEDGTDDSDDIEALNSEEEGESEDDDVDGESEEGNMENWLDLMDEAESARLDNKTKASKKQGNTKMNDDEDDDEINSSEDEDDGADGDDDEAFVQRELYRLDSDEDSDEEGANDFKHEDFFGKAPPTRRRNATENLQNTDVLNVSGSEDEESSNSEDDEGEDNDDDNDEAIPEKETNYSRKKSLLQEQISMLEEVAVGAKAWEVAGEVKSSQRPENSLLGIPVDVERSSKITPVINHEYLKTLEDMIIQRIKDSNFDNMIFEPPRDKNKQILESDELDVSQEKSKIGLGEIYADQFLKQSANFDANASKQEQDVNVMIQHFQKVCRQLDALSHFQFAPKPVGSSTDSSAMGVQSIALEDVAPITMLDGVGGGGSSAQAPEQAVGKKRGLDAQFIAGDEEVTREDRQKMRRKQKKKQGANRTTSGGAAALENDKFQDLKNDSRVTMKNSDRSSGKSEYSKSADFFSRMQNEVSTGINNKKLEREKRGEVSDQAIRSSRVKL